MGFLRHGIKYALPKTFENVTELVFTNCRLDRELCNLSIHFPRVRNISFFGRNEFQNLDSGVVRYPHLREMAVDRDSMNIINIGWLQVLNPTSILLHPLSYPSCMTHLLHVVLQTG